MAINPVLMKDGRNGRGKLIPLPQEASEDFEDPIDHIALRCVLPGRIRLTGTGQMFLSARRIVYVATHGSSREGFKSFEMPLNMMRKVSVHQPLFGPSYICFEIIANKDSPSPFCDGVTAVRLSFMEGECGTFLPKLFQAMKPLIRAQTKSPSSVTERTERPVAFVDPINPAVLYLSKPSRSFPAAPAVEDASRAGP